MTDLDRHETVVQLLGAWALNACSPEESDLVRAHLNRCAVCAPEARALRETAGELGGTSLSPPEGMAGRLRDAARQIRRPAAAAPAYAAPYAAQVAALDLMLSDLTVEDWRRVAAYGEWSVHDLVAHLAATDGLLAAALGVAVRPPVKAGENPVSRTAAVLDVERRRPAEQTRRYWRAQADDVCDKLLRHPSLATDTVKVGWRLLVPDAVVGRAFETWIHAADIAAATGRPSVAPLPEHVHQMADLSARLLPRVLARRAASPRPLEVRLHLTGAGGGTWTVPFVPDGSTGLAPAAVATIDVLEFCRLVGGRRDPDRISVDIRGDTAAAREMLAAAPGLSGP
jgi:uncharacterized protein (TIGR03083 family)